MNKLFFFSVLLVGAGSLHAQPWMPQHDGPVKYTEALNGYAQYHLQYEEDEPGDITGNEEKETGRDLFERWNWYWRQHLDKDGYMISPVKNLTEWQKYVKSHKPAAAKTSSLSANWIFQGPFTTTGNISSCMGRVNVVAFDPIDSNTFYIGSAAGSTWKTTNGGATWASLYDFLPNLGVSDIRVNPRNHNTIFVATGDADQGAYSSGVIVSYDAGTHWDTTGLTWSSPLPYHSIGSLQINPVDTTAMLVATNTGIFKTHDGGHTWSSVCSGNFKQVLFNPGDTSIIYATTQYTWPSAQIMRSVDGGTTWSVADALTGVPRINLAVCPASPNVVMAVSTDYHSSLDGIYSSTDNGATFTPVFTNTFPACANNLLGWSTLLPTIVCNGQGSYDLCIAIDPSNAANVTIGGVNTAYSSDGGLTWAFCGYSTVHVDKHCLAYSPLTRALFQGCDGGVYKNYSMPAGYWTNLSNGLYITEFYRNAVDNNVAFCLGGSQDNGTKKIMSGGISAFLTGSDGMQPLINYGNPNNIWYTSAQYGVLYMTRDGGLTFNNISPPVPGGGGWIAPYTLHPSDTATLLMGYKQVFVTHNNGATWDTLSPVFDPYNFIDRVVIAPSNPNYLYTLNFSTSHSDEVIHYSANFGVTWDTIATPFSAYISDIAVDPKNEKRFWVTLSTYGMPKVWKYDMVTNVWTDETGSLPDIMVACIIIDTMSKTKYIGTNAAVFYRDTSMTDWALFDHNLPTVRVSDMHINYTANELWAATYGRGMWKTTKADVSPLSQAAINVNSMINISPNPCHGSFVIRTNDNSLQGRKLSVKLIAADGQTARYSEDIMSTGGIRINTKNLPAGLYICEVNDGTKVLRGKVEVY